MGPLVGGARDSSAGSGGSDDVPIDEAGIRLCTALGIDPSEATEVTIEVEAGRGTVVRWSNVRRLDPDAYDRLIDALYDPPIDSPEVTC